MPPPFVRWGSLSSSILYDTGGLVGFFFCHILSNLFAESHQKPLSLQRAHVRISQSKNIMRMIYFLKRFSLSNAPRPCNILLFSPLAWLVSRKDRLCTHRSQTASDRGYSTTVAKYVKCLEMDYYYYYIERSARVICKLIGSGLHGII